MAAINLPKGLEVPLLGGIRGAFLMLFEHPFDSIKTQWQSAAAEGRCFNALGIVRDIYSQKGISGFYRGYVPNIVRVTMKNIYRWPMMIFLPSFYQNKIPSSLAEHYPGLPKVLVGLTIANLETFVVCPLERLKIWNMTTGENKRHSLLGNFFRESRSKVLFELFRGYQAQLWRLPSSTLAFERFLDFVSLQWLQI